MMKAIDEKVFISGQIRPEDVPAIAASGVRMIVNNRPDGEEASQPLSAEIEAAAAEAGIAYRFVPMTGLSAELIADMGDALAAADGPVLAFCKSGTRSTYLWALARSRMGDDGDALAEKAAAAGYDLTPVRRFL
jgi:uncharacterized protein (TIGR01244 family)